MDEFTAFRLAKDGALCPHVERPAVNYSWVASIPGVTMTQPQASLRCGQLLVFVRGQGLVCPEHGLVEPLD